MMIHPDRRRPRPGFTLTEILVVLVIIAILAAIAFSVVGPATTRAKTRATESLIQSLNGQLSSQMSALASKQFQPNLQIAGWEANLATNIQMATVMARIRHTAAAFPDQMNELCDGGNAPSRDPIGKDDSNWLSYGNPQKHPWIAMQRSQPLPSPPPAPANQALDSAECLYLIISEGPNATPGFMDKIQPRFIKTDPNRIDANNDGLKYFADAWGNPIRFDRWAVTALDAKWANPPGSNQVESTLFKPVALLSSTNWVPPARPKSPYDPDGLLLDPTWNSEPSTPAGVRAVFEQWFLPVRTNEPTATNRTPQGFNATAVLTSGGPDGNLGLQAAPLNRSDAPPAPAGVPSGIIPKYDQPLDDGSGGLTDNISSATFRLR